MANVRDEHTLDSNSQVPNVSESNQFVPEQGRLITVNHSVQLCMQVPEQLQHELPQATPEQAHDRIEPLSEPLPDANQEAKVTRQSIDSLVTLNEEETSGIVTSDQVPSRTLPDVRVISGFTPEQERELLSILADIRIQYSADRPCAKLKHHKFRGRPQDAVRVIAGPTVPAEEIFVTSPGTPPSEFEDSPQPDQTNAASEKERKRKSPEPSKATGTKRKYTRRAPATGAGASRSLEVPAQVPGNTQAWVDVPVQELANLTTLADTTTTTIAKTATVVVQANLDEPVNDVDERVSKEAVEKWLEDCRLKE